VFSPYHYDTAHDKYISQEKVIMSFLGHPLHGNEFLLLGKQQCKDGPYYKVQLADESIGCLPARWFDSQSGQNVTSDESALLASIEAIRKFLLLVDHLENRTPPNVE
jgi:hypothetical protein